MALSECVFGTMGAPFQAWWTERLPDDPQYAGVSGLHWQLTVA